VVGGVRRGLSSAGPDTGEVGDIFGARGMALLDGVRGRLGQTLPSPTGQGAANPPSAAPVTRRHGGPTAQQRGGMAMQRRGGLLSVRGCLFAAGEDLVSGTVQGGEYGAS
jgi:hypothetical protein